MARPGAPAPGTGPQRTGPGPRSTPGGELPRAGRAAGRCWCRPPWEIAAAPPWSPAPQPGTSLPAPRRAGAAGAVTPEAPRPEPPPELPAGGALADRRTLEALAAGSAPAEPSRPEQPGGATRRGPPGTLAGSERPAVTSGSHPGAAGQPGPAAAGPRLGPAAPQAAAGMSHAGAGLRSPEATRSMLTLMQQVAARPGARSDQHDPHHRNDRSRPRMAQHRPAT